MPADRLLGGGGVPGGELLTDRLVLLTGTLREGHVVEGTGDKAQLLVVKLLIDALQTVVAGLCHNKFMEALVPYGGLIKGSPLSMACRLRWMIRPNVSQSERVGAFGPQRTA